MTVYEFNLRIKNIDRLIDEYCAVSSNIDELTKKIKEHKAQLNTLKLFPLVDPTSYDIREQYHQWRKKSFTLHNKRSDLKIHRMAISERINDMLVEDEAA